MSTSIFEELVLLGEAHLLGGLVRKSIFIDHELDAKIIHSYLGILGISSFCCNCLSPTESHSGKLVDPYEQPLRVTVGERCSNIPGTCTDLLEL